MPKLPEDKLTTPLIVLSGSLGHLCSEEYLKTPIIMDFNLTTTNQLSNGSLKL